jgi:cyclophilin family peptidyl-prolyl cis-trans isomerase
VTHSFFHRFFRRSTHDQPPRRRPGFEPLEDRTMLSAVTITGVTADNRGEVIISLSGPVVASQVNKTSVEMFTPGKDNKLSTPDDVLRTVTIKYTSSNNRITIFGNTPVNSLYRVKVIGSLIHDKNGVAVDGEFNGKFPSGNGKAGGSFEFVVQNDSSATPVAQFLTSEGTMDVTLFKGKTKTNIATPKNVASFISFANKREYDNIFVSRDALNFVVQMGGLAINSQDHVVQVPDIADGSVPGEPGNSNLTGTVAFALSNGPNTADNEFYFNLADNTDLDGTQAGGPFTVFGKVSNAHSLAVLDAINGLNRLDLSNSSIGALGTDVSNVPVNPNVPVKNQTSQNGGSTTKVLDPSTDFVVVTRVALLMKITATA